VRQRRRSEGGAFGASTPRVSAVRGTDLRGDTLKMTAKVFGFEQDGSFVNT
jgi:hypothetical protein